MASKIRCFHMPKPVGQTVVEANDPDMTWFLSQIRAWANNAAPGDKFILTAARFTRLQIDSMAEYEGADVETDQGGSNE